jgi:RNA polymerase sigma-70 factor (ECF subfamily)
MCGMAPDQNPDELIPTHWSLIGRLKDLDDQQGWRQFYDTYWRLVFGVAIKSGLTEAEAQDVVQDTMVSVSQKMPQFKAEPQAGSFKGFLLAITRRRIVDQFRKRSPQAAAGDGRSDETARTSTIETIADPASLNLDAVWNLEWEKNLMNAAVERVKRQVNLKQAQIYDLYVVKQWPVKKIAATLGVNIGQVYLAKHRFACLLKKEIQRLKEKMD